MYYNFTGYIVLGLAYTTEYQTHCIKHTGIDILLPVYIHVHDIAFSECNILYCEIW